MRGSVNLRATTAPNFYATLLMPAGNLSMTGDDVAGFGRSVHVIAQHGNSHGNREVWFLALAQSARNPPLDCLFCGNVEKQECPAHHPNDPHNSLSSGSRV